MNKPPISNEERARQQRHIEIRLAIAQWSGKFEVIRFSDEHKLSEGYYDILKTGRPWVARHGGVVVGWEHVDKVHDLSDVPNYPVDLNAAQAAFGLLNAEQKDRCVKMVEAMLQPGQFLFDATAEQRSGETKLRFVGTYCVGRTISGGCPLLPTIQQTWRTARPSS